MGSFSLTKSFLHIPAILAMVLFQNSFAFECYSCDETDPSCTPQPCPPTYLEDIPGIGSEFLCTAVYKANLKRGKGCASKKWYDEILEGSDKCVELSADEYFTRSSKIFYKFNPDKATTISEDDYVEGAKNRGSSQIPDYDPEEQWKVCSCSGDLCNGEEFDRKHGNVGSGNILESGNYNHSRNIEL